MNDNLRQLSIGSVTAKSYICYDVNGYRFRISIFEFSHPLSANGITRSIIGPNLR
jgi:hypothetical protein